MEQFTIEPLQNSQDEGEIPASLASELWVRALRNAWTGSLTIFAGPGHPTQVRFVSGRTTRFQSPDAAQIIKSTFEHHLPPEQVQLISQHAAQFQVDELMAIQRLRLVPDEVLYRLHQECTLALLLHLVEAGGKLRFRFQTGHDCFRGHPGFEHPVENLPLLTDCLLQATDLSWHHGRLSSRKDEVLKLCGDAMRPELLHQGLLRQVILALRRKPESFSALQARLNVHDDALVAVVYALRATGCIQRANQHVFNRPTTAIRFTPTPDEGAISAAQQRSAAPSGAQRTPVRISESPSSGLYRPSPSAATSTSTSGVRAIDLGASHEAERSKLPPSSGRAPPPSSLKPTPTPASQLDQNAVESAALGAWMRAMDDPGTRKKALHVVEEASRRFPKNPRILFYLGCLYVLSNRKDEAETAMERVLDLDPEHIEARRELATLQKGSDKGPGGSLFRRLRNRRSV